VHHNTHSIYKRTNKQYCRSASKFRKALLIALGQEHRVNQLIIAEVAPASSEKWATFPHVPVKVRAETM
jgi:hypothetical protein